MSLIEEKLVVIAVDWGRLFEVDRSEASAVPPELEEEITRLPYQAIECCLTGVLPTGTEWTDAAGDLLWDKLCESDNLFAKVATHHFSL